MENRCHFSISIVPGTPRDTERRELVNSMEDSLAKYNIEAKTDTLSLEFLFFLLSFLETNKNVFLEKIGSPLEIDDAHYSIAPPTYSTYHAFV